jgi:DoxX-like family
MELELPGAYALDLERVFRSYEVGSEKEPAATGTKVRHVHLYFVHLDKAKRFTRVVRLLRFSITVSKLNQREESLATTKSKQNAYWGSTILVLLPTAGTGIPELFTHGPAATVQIIHTLGYPLYIMQITGLAKILGAIPLLLNRPLRLVEWAYAGFTFLLLGATASHVLAGDAAHAPVPFICLLLLMVSYVLRPQVRGV